MTDWSLVFMGVMAVALMVMATTQIFVALSLLRTSRQLTETIRELQRDVRPLIEKATRMSDDAARVTALALTQVERIDRLVSNVAGQVEDTIGIVRGAIIAPVREGTAMIAAFRAVMSAVREWQVRRPAPRDDEDPLFVG